MTKQELRYFIRQQKQQFSSQELETLSEPIIKRLLAHPRVHAAETIMMYYSLDDEVCTHTAIDRLVAMGKKVLLPAVTSDTDIELRCYTGPKDLEGGFFNIKEPVGKAFSKTGEIELAVVPGMAFDARGHRLGRGKGYYDRFLATIPKAYKIGICFPFQKLPGIPADAHDIAMDEII